MHKVLFTNQYRTTYHNRLNAFRRFGQSQKFSNAKNPSNGPWDMTCNNVGTNLEMLWEVVG